MLVLAPACSLDDQSSDAVVVVGERTITERDVEGALEHFREKRNAKARSSRTRTPPPSRPRGSRWSACSSTGRRSRKGRSDSASASRRPPWSDGPTKHAKPKASPEGGEEEEGEEEGEESLDYIRDTIRAQLAYVGAYRTVTGRVVVGDPEIARFYRQNRSRFGGRPLAEVRETLAAELLQVKRSRAMNRWVEETRRTLPPRYEEGEE